MNEIKSLLNNNLIKNIYILTQLTPEIEDGSFNNRRLFYEVTPITKEIKCETKNNSIIDLVILNPDVGKYKIRLFTRDGSNLEKTFTINVI